MPPKKQAKAALSVRSKPFSLLFFPCILRRRDFLSSAKTQKFPLRSAVFLANLKIDKVTADVYTQTIVKLLKGPLFHDTDFCQHDDEDDAHVPHVHASLCSSELPVRFMIQSDQFLFIPDREAAAGFPVFFFQ